MQYFMLLCMSKLLPLLCITTCTTARYFLKFLVFELLMYGKNISFSGIKTIQLFKKSVVITGSIEFDIALTLMLC